MEEKEQIQARVFEYAQTYKKQESAKDRRSIERVCKRDIRDLPRLHREDMWEYFKYHRREQ